MTTLVVAEALKIPGNPGHFSGGSRVTTLVVAEALKITVKERDLDLELWLLCMEWDPEEVEKVWL